MDFSIVNLYSPGFAYAHSVDDAIFPLYYGLSRLGYAVEILDNTLGAHSCNIIFGLQDMPELSLELLPKNSIIYNFEQLQKNSKAARPHYLEALQNFTVWEYSLRNMRVLSKGFGVKSAVHVPLGYMPEMQRISPDYPKDIDVLFYGCMNTRRLKLIQALQAKGIKAVGVEKVWGAERDFLIARSKITLNVHHYTPGILEVVRLSYLLANQKAIVSELNADTEMHAGYEEACIFCPYEELVDKISVLLRKPALCEAQAAKGFAVFAQNDFKKTLEDVVGPKSGTASFSGAYAQVPDKFNAGSGKDYRLDHLNVDISAKWNPDIVADLSVPLDSSKIFSTRRFGDIALTPGYFSSITANDVLEHVPDLIQTMTNFLDLLREGGALRVIVPYDLSLGAWQDPTHIRSFNENSWKYYTEWAWYLGWREWRFELTELTYDLSDSGNKLQVQGMPGEEILRAPRAVDSMSATLVKRQCTPEEKLEYDKRHAVFYKVKS